MFYVTLVNFQTKLANVPIVQKVSYHLVLVLVLVSVVHLVLKPLVLANPLVFHANLESFQQLEAFVLLALKVTFQAVEQLIVHLVLVVMNQQMVLHARNVVLVISQMKEAHAKSVLETLSQVQAPVNVLCVHLEQVPLYPIAMVAHYVVQIHSRLMDQLVKIVHQDMFQTLEQVNVLVVHAVQNQEVIRPLVNFVILVISLQTAPYANLVQMVLFLLAVLVNVNFADLEQKLATEIPYVICVILVNSLLAQALVKIVHQEPLALILELFLVLLAVVVQNPLTEERAVVSARLVNSQMNLDNVNHVLPDRFQLDQVHALVFNVQLEQNLEMVEQHANIVIQVLSHLMVLLVKIVQLVLLVLQQVLLHVKFVVVVWKLEMLDLLAVHCVMLVNLPRLPVNVNHVLPVQFQPDQVLAHASVVQMVLNQMV